MPVVKDVAIAIVIATVSAMFVRWCIKSINELEEA